MGGFIVGAQAHKLRTAWERTRRDRGKLEERFKKGDFSLTGGQDKEMCDVLMRKKGKLSETKKKG